MAFTLHGKAVLCKTKFTGSQEFLPLLSLVRAKKDQTMIRASPCERLVFYTMSLCCIPMLEVSAMAAQTDSPQNFQWQDLFSNKVVICGGAAVALLVLSLLLRGLLKLISLALVLVLAIGVFFFARDAWTHRSDLLPHEWSVAAERTIQSRKAMAAWKGIQAELSRLSSDARRRLAAGTDDARHSLITTLENKARELRKAGHASEADELIQLGRLLGAQR